MVTPSSSAMSRLALLRLVRRFSSEKLSFNVMNLKQRGLIEVLLPAGSENYFNGALNRPRTFYCGFDPTAPSLHLGNLAVLMLLLQVQRRGHNVVALVGGGTAVIGDPSGRTSERSSLTETQLIENSTHVTNTLLRLFKNHKELARRQKHFNGSLGSWEVIDNAYWNAGISAVDLAVDVGSHLRLSDLLSKESVRQRMDGDQGMSLREFMYPLFQANDWLHLFREHDCITQIGGNDQQGNIDIGQQLIRKVTKNRVFGLTVPLLTRKDGSKIGKSDDHSSQTIWLNPERTSPFEFYQHLIRTVDDDVERLLKIFTFLPLTELDDIMKQHWAKPELRIAQKTLAKEVTSLVHGEKGFEIALVATDIAFPPKDSTNSDQGLRALNEDVAMNLKIPILKVALEPNINLHSLIMKTGIFSSESGALNRIQQGSVAINHRTITSPMQLIQYDAHITPNNFSLLRIGKRKFFVVQWTN